MKNNLVSYGYISKGRMKDGVDALFKKKNLKISSRDRQLFGHLKKYPNVRINYMNAKEIVNSLGTGVCDIAITGIDLWKESEPSIQSKIRMVKKYDFAKAELSVCVPQIWLDCVNTADLEEISYEFYNKKKRLMRVATGFKNLTREWFNSKGITQYEIIDAQSGVELYPWISKSDICVDLVSTGFTLRQNRLKQIASIIKSSAALFVNKNSMKKKGVKKLLKLLSK